MLAPGAGVATSATALVALAFFGGLGAARGAASSFWIAAQMRVVAFARFSNFFTGFRSSKPGVPAKLFQVSTRRLIGHSAVALLSSFWLANTTRLSCAAGGASSGPQLLQAIPVCRALREKYPRVPIVWGGYFASLYTEASLNAGYVDFVVKGQGEDTLIELIDELRGSRDFSHVRGLSFKDQFGLHVHTAARALKAPDDFPWLPYHRMDPAKYIAPTFPGSRTAVHQASIGCPFRCNFCGVVPVYDREKMESPARTAAILGHMQAKYGVNAVQSYDNNFFLREDHARELAERIAPLDLRWWCEARVDIVLGYSDDTLRRLRAAGCVMIFFGVESGNDEALRNMKKQLSAQQTLELAHRIRQFGIVPEYSMIFGNPDDTERDLEANIAFVRRVKNVNPAVEIVVQTYVPTPQRNGAWGDVEVVFPGHPRRVDHGPLVSVPDSHLPATALAAGPREAPHTGFRDRDELAVARHAGYAPARLGTDAAAIVEQLALRDGRIRFSG